MMKKQPNQVQEAFSRQAVSYDSYEQSNEILKWMRNQVRKHTLLHLNPEDHILEINAGTGIDAVFFAALDHQVHATDLSAEMIKQLEKKVSALKLEDKITVQHCSYTELNDISKRFDYVFSNFGGLNCISDLNPVARRISELLKPGGMITLVIMPPVCPWELTLMFRGYAKTALRRWRKKGVLAHIEGIYFTTYYFTPGHVLKTFNRYNFRKIDLQGLASVSPPPYMMNFPTRYPRLYKFLTLLDERLSRFPPFNF